MAEWILTSSLLIVIVLAVRALFRGRMGLRLRYALWLLVLLRLLVPGTVFQTGLSVLNYVPLSQTAAAQAQPSQSGGSPSDPEAEPSDGKLIDRKMTYDEYLESQKPQG